MLSTKKKPRGWILTFLFLGLFLLAPTFFLDSESGLLGRGPLIISEHVSVNVAYAQAPGNEILGEREAHKPDPDTVPSPFACKFSNWSFLGCMGQLAFVVLSLFGSLLIAAGITLNAAIQLTIGNMSQFVEQMGGINAGWRVLRDLSNIIILFLLLFSAIGIIFRSDKIVPRGTLVKIIIAALLINFSMFFTKVIIDISNVLTFQIHQSLEKFEGTPAQIFGDDPLTVVPAGIAGLFLHNLNPITIFNDAAKQPASEEVSAENLESHIFQQMLFGIVVVLIATFVLFSAAIMLIVRFLILIFLLITSPIGFVGGLIPKLQTYSKQWWETLIGQAFFAPVLMLFFLITVKIIEDPTFKAGLSSVGICDATWCNSTVMSLFNFSGGLVGLIQYAFIIFFLIMSLVVAKGIAGKAGSGVTSAASKWAGAAAFGGAAFLGAQTLGRLGKMGADSQFANNLQGSDSFAKRMVGRSLINIGKGFGEASYDARGAGWAKGLGAGKAAPGYIKREKDEAKRIADAREKISLREDGEAGLEATKLREDLEKNKKTMDDLRAGIEAARKKENDAMTPFVDKEQAKKERMRLEEEQKEWSKKETRLAEIERDNPKMQQQRQKEARSQIAELARVLSSRQIRNAHDVANSVAKETNQEKRESMLATLHGKEQDIARAITNLASATENIKNIKANTNQKFIDQNVNAGGALGAAVTNIQKEMRKSKEEKILKNAIAAEVKKESGGDSGDKKSGGKDGSGEDSEEKTA